MKKLVKKYGIFIISFTCLICFILYFQSVFNINFPSYFKKFQNEITNKEKQLIEYSKLQNQLFKSGGIKAVKIHAQKNEYFVHIYRNDSLIYWNQNQLPILRFADIHFPSEGIVKLQNAWYYTKIIRKKNIQIVSSFLIKKEYAIENEYLINEFDSDFNIPFDVSIGLERGNAYPIFNLKKQFLFALSPKEITQATDFESNLMILFFFLALVFFLYGVYIKLSNSKENYQLGLSSLILILHFIGLKTSWYSFLEKTTFYDPALYASSNWFPNFFILIFNCILIFFYISILVRIINTTSNSVYKKIVTFSVFIFSFIFAWFITYLYQSLVKDSSIPIEIEKLFKLNYYSFWASFSMGILFFSYFILVKACFMAILKFNIQKKTILFLWFISGVLFFIYDINFGSKMIISSVWPLLINGIIVLNCIRSDGKFSFNYGVILLFLFAAFIAININDFLAKKEKQERELFAAQLASDQDISTEIEFQILKNSICYDKYFQKLFDSPRELTVSEFKDFMERKYYNRFWEKYEADFSLFNHNKENLIKKNNFQNSTFKDLEEILSKHSKISEIDSQIFYIKDYTSQLSYISKLLIYNEDSSKHLHLYTTLKSKRIPEKIGFPRLLISNDAHVFKAIENYSIAKYYNKKLVSQNGKFSYPIEDFALTSNNQDAYGYFNTEEYNHYLFRKNSRDLIVLSKKTPTFFQLFTSFSYLFCFFGFFLLIHLLIKNFKNLTVSRLTLAFKIQLVLVSIVVMSLLFFGLGNGKFVNNQYYEYTNELIKEKVKSVLVEIKAKLGNEKVLNIEKNGENISYYLQKFASVFVTDINMYDKNGYLLGSSRPKIFNAGLLGEQINPKAFNHLKNLKKSEFIHNENIGKLNFLSAYVPLYNTEGKFLAYINLQHFGQQQGFENQIENFLVAIINVFILLLAFSIIFSILASNWLTSPLKIIQQSFAKIQLGKYNEPIEYQSNDEIGALVKNYNQKLEELAFTAQQLAQSERESAWREMAKQVAHEIKNPLTPMKLSLQHFQRIFDPNDPSSKVKLDKVVLSIVEQIDALTLIANEFSNFAKMPQENKEIIDILPLIQNAILVFNQENIIDIQLENQEKEIKVFADKDLIIRVFNNLIKNAIQAIPEDRIGKICIRITKKEHLFLFEIEDNGKGIPDEQKNKIFVPNFTTKSTGTGLGLAMVKQIIELHGGKIWFESIVNKKTSFIFEMPINEKNQ